jgi:transcriptional regulator with XRE-family HTH domain
MLSFHDALKQARKKAGMTQADLGERFNVSGASVGKWEKRYSSADPGPSRGTSPTYENYQKLLEIFPELKEVRPPRRMKKPRKPYTKRQSLESSPPVVTPKGMHMQLSGEGEVQETQSPTQVKTSLFEFFSLIEKMKRGAPGTLAMRRFFELCVAYDVSAAEILEMLTK